MFSFIRRYNLVRLVQKAVLFHQNLSYFFNIFFAILFMSLLQQRKKVVRSRKKKHNKAIKMDAWLTDVSLKKHENYTFFQLRNCVTTIEFTIVIFSIFFIKI
jgi:predicted nucleotide-binding protein (sugar kinase/HSP70/actin superfamily)